MNSPRRQSTVVQTSARNHAIRLRRARQAGRDHALPGVSDLVARPDFAPLRDWLAAQQVDLHKLQQQIDAFAARCRAQAEEDPAESR